MAPPQKRLQNALPAVERAQKDREDEGRERRSTERSRALAPGGFSEQY
jgi:hypothetical protein